MRKFRDDPTAAADLFRILFHLQQRKYNRSYWAVYDIALELKPEDYPDRDFPWLYDAVSHLIRKYRGKAAF